MAARLLTRITESSLMEQSIPTRYVFLMLLAIANEHGVVIGTDIAISRRLNMDTGEFEQCVRNLMQPDANSNSKDHEGKRIVLSDSPRGYLIVNYLKYRSEGKSGQTEERRAYMRNYMQKRRNANAQGKPEEPIQKAAANPNPQPIEPDLFGTETAPVAAKKQSNAALPTTDTAKRLATMMHRRLTTEWQPNEIKAFKKIGTIEEEDLAALENYYASNWPPQRDVNILRHDLLTLLNNIRGEIDRARAFEMESSQPKHRALQGTQDPDGWREFLAGKAQPYSSYQYAKTYLKDEFERSH